MSYSCLRNLLGLLLLVAAALKGHQVATEPILGDDFLHSRWLLVGSVEVELFFGLLLLSGALQRPTWKLSLALFSLLGGISLWSAITGADTCGCFGKVAVDPWWIFTLDCCVVASLLRWRPDEVPTDFRVRGIYRTGAALALSLLIGIPAGFAMSTFSPSAFGDDGDIPAAGEIVVLEPAGWKGRRLPILRHLDSSEELSSGAWVLVFFHHDCPKCQAVIPDYESLAARLQSQRAEPRVALIEMPPFGGGPVTMGSACRMGKLKPSHTWFMPTPCEVTITDGVVQHIVMPGEEGRIAGGLPSQATAEARRESDLSPAASLAARYNQ